MVVEAVKEEPKVEAVKEEPKVEAVVVEAVKEEPKVEAAKSNSNEALDDDIDIITDKEAKEVQTDFSAKAQTIANIITENIETKIEQNANIDPLAQTILATKLVASVIEVAKEDAKVAEKNEEPIQKEKN